MTATEQAVVLRRWLPLSTKALTARETHAGVLGACEWGFDSVFSGTGSARAVLLCIALEALLGGGDGKEGKKELAKRLADRISEDRSESEQVQQRFVEFYNIRNQVVHRACTPRDRQYENLYSRIGEDFMKAVKQTLLD